MTSATETGKEFIPIPFQYILKGRTREGSGRDKVLRNRNKQRGKQEDKDRNREKNGCHRRGERSRGETRVKVESMFPFKVSNVWV